jgi:hypothetical protein
MSEDDVRLLRETLPGITDECVEKLRFAGIDAFPERTDECFEMAPAKRWTGLWRNEFEGSRFCPSPAQDCSFDSPGDRIWLSYANVQGPGSEAVSEGLYAIEFVGRRTLKRGSHGHFGASDHEIIVDRLMSIKQAIPSTSRHRDGT